MFHVSKDAERDLDEIFLYWAARVSIEVADRLIDGIMYHFSLLGEYPDAGRLSNQIEPGVRCFPAGRYLIYYRKSKKGTEILNVVHGARNQRKAVRRPK